MGHIRQIHLGPFRYGQGQRFHGGVHMLHDLLLADGPFRKHVRFPLQIAVLVQDFQGAEQIIGGIVGKGQGIGARVDQSILGGIGVIQGIQPVLESMNGFVAVIIHLRVHELPHTVPQLHHARRALLGGLVQLGSHHQGIFPVIYLSFHHGVGEVGHIGIGGNGVLDFFSFGQVGKLRRLVAALNMGDSFG